TMSAPIIAADFSADILATTGKSIWGWYEGGYQNWDPVNPPIDPQAVSAGPWPVTITGCPPALVSFQLNEPDESTTGTDESGILIGTVGNPIFAFQNSDGYFHGDEDEGTYIEFSNNQTCLNSPRAVTVEARVRPTEVDRGIADNTFNRIFERRRTMLVTILNTDYRGDDVPERAGKASIEIKYRVENVYEPGARHTCPNPQWPADPYVGNDVRMHQISSDIARWPLYDNHWYQIKVVFNSDKGAIYGTVVDIFIDDQGTDGLNALNPTPLNPTSNPDFEQWPGYEKKKK
ncbi:MAG: hypothetical protein GY869_00810, partial [Planctomycetes bacterium]|nr:hypothetical protein [Planctomycetota bacterium]